MNHHNILTPKGERYVAEHGNVLVAFRLRDPLFDVPGITAHEVRRAVETEVDRLIRLLDAFDGDDDERELDTDYESSLGGREFAGQVDLEAEEADDERLNEDDENELDLRESDGLDWGELDESEYDSGRLIPGGSGQ